MTMVVITAHIHFQGQDTYLQSIELTITAYYFVENFSGDETDTFSTEKWLYVTFSLLWQSLHMQI